MTKTVELLRKFEQKFRVADLGEFGVLPPEKATEFINLTLSQSALLNAVTTYQTDYQAGEFYTFDIPGHVLAGDSEGEEWDGTDTGKFVTNKAFQYSCTKVKSAFRLSWETVAWALEGEGGQDFEDFLVTNWTRRLKDDIEYLGLAGDTDSADPFLRLNDGWLKLIAEAADAHIIDWQGEPITPELWQEAYATFIMDPYARKIAKDLYWIANPIVYTQYMHYLARRQDNLGAASLMGAVELRPDGIPFFNGQKGVPLMPVTRSGETLLTDILLGDPKQLWLVIHREFRAEYMREPIQDTWLWIGRSYIDFVVPFPRTFILIKNVSVSEIAKKEPGGGS